MKFDFENQPGINVRNLREVKLYEISPVPLGMNALTEIRAVKAAMQMRNDDGPRNVMNDEVMLKAYVEKWNAFILEMKEGRVLSTSSKEKVVNAIGAMEGAMDALNDLLTAAEPQKMLHSALLTKRLRAAELQLVSIAK